MKIIKKIPWYKTDVKEHKPKHTEICSITYNAAEDGLPKKEIEKENWN